MQQLRTTIAMNPKVNQIELRLEKKLEKNVADFASKLQAIQNSADSQELKDKRIKALTDEFKSREFALKKQALKEKRRAETPFLQRVQKRFKLAYNRQHFDFESFAKNVQYQNFSFGKKKIVAEIDNLRLSFSNPAIHNYRSLVIRNTSIKFYEGEIHAVIGESGSGKSVITSALYGLTGNNAIIEEGSIKLFNNEVQDFSFRDWELSNYRGKVISAVFQNPISTLNPTKKVGKQITEGMLINGIVKTKKEAKAKAIEYLKLTKINNPEQVMELYPHELSGGMIQRVVISAILSLEPKIIVMDEPTTALDTTVQALVLDIVRDLQKKLKITIIFITHDLGVVASLATYISIMYAGQVIEEGTRDEILNNPQHPYTWGLILSMPDLNKGSRLSTIRGVVPSSLNEIVGDAFAVRNDYALEQDFYVEPNFYYLSETHRVKSALLDPKAPKVNPPELIAQKQAQWARTHSSNSTLIALKMKEDMEDKFYLEHRIKKYGILNKTVARRLTKGTQAMLDAYPEKEQLVKFRSVDITYGSGKNTLKAISDLNMNIYKGEILSLVGESGSGKSTTGSALAALTSHSFGSITIGSETLPHKTTQINSKLNNYLVANVQMIFQDPVSSLNPHKNIFKVVSEGIDNLELKTKGGIIKKIFLQNFDENVFRNLVDILAKDNNWSEHTKELYLNKFFQLEEENKELAYDYLYVKFLNELAEQNTQKAQAYLQQSQATRKEKEALSSAKLKYELILEMLKSVGLDESVLKRFPLEFSGGQQQRIGISRALVLRPKLLIADEPISALDVSIQAQVINIFKDLKQKYNLTILFISHDLRMVEYISDRIAVINKGKLLEIGPTKEIMQNFLHPYTKSLMEAIPAIDSTSKSLLGYVYDPQIHEYSEDNQPEWVNLGNNHFVLATKDEVSQWKKGVYKTWKN